MLSPGARPVARVTPAAAPEASFNLIFTMKYFLSILLAVGFASRTDAASLDPAVAEAALYVSGGKVEPLRQIERAVRESVQNPAQRPEVEAALIKLLAPTATFEARRFACAQLSVVGTEASLPAIAELLKQAETTGMACLALASRPSPRVKELLRAALPGSRGLATAQIVVTLGDLGDTAAVKPLAELARGADTDAAAAAIGSLGKIASEEALAELAALRRGGNAEQSRLAVLASLVAADNAVRLDNRAAARSIYDELSAATQPVPVRRAAFEGMLRTDADDGEERALIALRGDDAVLKASAIVRVRALKSRDASAVFAKEMDRLAAGEKVSLLASLASRNDAAAHTAIADQLLASDAVVRQAAIGALADLGDATFLPQLILALSAAQSAAERQTIEQALAGLKGGDRVDRQILARESVAAGESGPVIKAALINALARRGSQIAVTALLKEAGNTNPVVAKAAFRALGQLAGADRLPAVLDSLVNLKAPAARGEAESSAIQVLGRVADNDRRATAVVNVLAEAKDTETRCSLVGLLPVCGGERALAAVKSARAEAPPRVREAAFRAWCEWPEAAAVDGLLEIVQTARDPTERALAFRGGIRLLGSANDFSDRELADRFQKVLAAATSVDEKKLVLGAVANAHDPLALNLVEPLLSDPAVAAEAAQATVRLAPFVCGTAREATRASLQKVASLPVGRELQQSAKDLFETIGQFDDFILAWEVTEPYAQEGKDGQSLFEVTFPPEQTGARVKWRVMPAGTLKPRPWQLDLGRLYGGEQRVAYARTWIHSENQRAARLEFGGDDGLKVWLNGKVVLSANRGGDVVPGAEKAAVTLEKGWNSLLLKITQWNSGWGFCARAAQPDGARLQGVRAELNPAR